MVWYTRRYPVLICLAFFWLWLLVAMWALSLSVFVFAFDYVFGILRSSFKLFILCLVNPFSQLGIGFRLWLSHLASFG